MQNDSDINAYARKIFSVKEAANYIGISERNLRSKISSGELKVVRLGRRIIIRLKEIEGFLERNLR